MFSKYKFTPFLLLACVLFFIPRPSSAQNEEGNYITLNEVTPLRVLRSGALVSNEDLKELPKGSVIWIPKTKYDPKKPVAPKKQDYWLDAKTAVQGSFVGDVRLVAVPGLTDEKITALNTSHTSEDGKLYLSYKMLLDDSSSAENTVGGVAPPTPCCQTDSSQKNLDLLQDIAKATTEIKPDENQQSIIQTSTRKDCQDDRKSLIEMAPIGEVKTTAEAVFAKNPDLPASARSAIDQAFQFLNSNLSTIKNRNHMTVVDYTQPSSANRFYSINLSTGEIIASEVSHGRVSDDGKKQNFSCYSNKDGSNASPSGFLMTGELYTGKHGRSVRLHGLESKNGASCDRAIVVHQAKYIGDDSGGRSQGCPAIPQSKQSKDLIEQKLDSGALFYNFTADIRECTQKDIDSKKAKGKKKKKKKKRA
jgi:hypothetical protein